MALDIAGNLYLARPVSAYYEGKALRLAQQRDKQDLALGEQQLELNRRKLDAGPEAPDPDDVLKVEQIMSERGEQTVRGYEALRDSVGEEAAQRWATRESSINRGFIRENYPFMNDFLQEGEFNYELARAAMPRKDGDLRDRKIEDYLSLGASREEAIDVADGNLAVSSTPDQFGNVTVTNTRTGTASQMPARRAEEFGLAPQPSQPAQTSAPAQRAEQDIPTFFQLPTTAAPGLSAQNVSDAQTRLNSVNKILAFAPGVIDTVKAGDVVGPAQSLQRGVGGALNLLTFGAIDLFSKERFNARELRQFNKQIEEGFISNPRFPVAEREFVQGLLPQPGDLTSNDERAMVDLLQVITTVANRGEADLAALEGRQPQLIERPRTGFKIDPIELNFPLNQFEQRANEIERYIRTQPAFRGKGTYWIQDSQGQRIPIEVL